jgi:CRP/FNR family transcriptional regulator
VQTADNPLKRLPLLSHLPDAQRTEVLNAGHERRLGRGDILFHERDEAEAIFAVVEGHMKLVRYSPRGKEMLLHLVRPGESFAEAALFGSGEYPATAVAVEKSLLWCLPRRHLEDLIRRSPEIGLSMLASISVWTRKLASQLELLTQRRVEERLALYVIGRAGRQILETGATVTLSQPKNLIAAQCGTAPEVLSRTFRRPEEDGILSVEGDLLKILDADRLQALAEWIDD